jgi:succinate dehydrogenase/fumarate reductase cytochrome b subunit
MKPTLKYGLIITLGVMAWVIIAHLLVPDPQSPVHSLGAFTFFNLLHFSVIFLGLKAIEREKQAKQTFKEGLKTGLSISFVYAVTAALFFVGVIAVVGTKWMAGEAGASQRPTWMTAVQAFAGLIIFTMLLGLVYSTLISFVLAKRLSSET